MKISNNIYEELLDLVEQDKGFYIVEQEYDGNKYEVFSYRLVSWFDFSLPSAKECRGITFRVDGDNRELVSLPMHKFFNWHEGDLSEVIDIESDYHHHEDKMDGSLISTVVSDDGYVLKSKTSFGSDHATQAREIVSNDPVLDRVLKGFVDMGATVNMELTSPDYRIVVAYDEPKLTILNVRMFDGSYLPREAIIEAFNSVGEAKEYLVTAHITHDPAKFLEDVYEMGGEDEELIEGFVVVLKNQDMFKVKTNRYLRLHRAKDMLSVPGKMFDVIINSEQDDLKAAFHDDVEVVASIEDMESKLIPYYNEKAKFLDDFIEENMELSIKDFAIKAKAELCNMGFHYAIQTRRGKEVSLVDFFVNEKDTILRELGYE